MHHIDATSQLLSLGLIFSSRKLIIEMSPASSEIATGFVYRAAVIGAGPAGIAALGQMLDMSMGPVAWIDPSFAGGRLLKYREVPRCASLPSREDIREKCWKS